jgi:hypothetical protein
MNDVTHRKPPVRMVAKRRIKRLDSMDWLAFAIPFLRFIQVKVVGVLSGADILVMIAFVYLGFRGKLKLETRQARTLMVLCSLWLVAQIVTDRVRHTAFADYARGWSNIGFTIATFAVLLTLLYRRSGRLMLYGWGLVAGSLLNYWITPDTNMQADPWKFGIALPVTWAVLLFASRKSCRGNWPVILAMSIGILNFALGTRGLGGFCLAAAFYLSATRFLRDKTAGGMKLKAGAVMGIAASVVFGAIGIVWGYSYAAKSGLLGEHAREKYQLESAGKYGVLLGGRVTVLGALPAIYASPILGHGSWARDPLYAFLEKRALVLLGYDDPTEFNTEDMKEGYIPEHSYILGAWVNAGILGALFWFWVFVLTARALLRVYPPSVPMLPMAAFAGFATMWDLAFSPYGAEMRIITPYYIVLLMTCMAMASRASAKAMGGVATRSKNGSKRAAPRANAAASSGRTS